MAILQDTSKPVETLEQQVARLMAENARLKAASQRKLTLKVSKRGAISLYGTGKFPITLYRETWNRVLDMAGDIKQFAEDHAGLLSTGKDDPRFLNVGED